MPPTNPLCDSVTSLTNTLGALHTRKHTFTLLTGYYYGNQVKKYKMGGACGTNGGEEK